ncbi:antibiotic biosynthesis monooxygenase [Streptomyces lydicus]
MPLSTDFPDVRRPDAATVLVSPWLVPAPGLQGPAAASVLAEWEHRQRPDAMLSLTAFLSTDGSHVLNYAQWTNDEDHREWVRTGRPAVVRRIDRALAGIRRPGPVRYRCHRSHVPAETAGLRPGLLVTPAHSTDGPAAQRAVADTVDAVLREERVPGLLGVHVHLSRDGRRVLRYTEWTDEAAWHAYAGQGSSARLDAALAGLRGVAPAPAVDPAGATPPDHGAAAYPELPAVPRYRLYGSLLNIAPQQGT